MATHRGDGTSGGWDQAERGLEPARATSILHQELQRARKRIGLRWRDIARKRIVARAYAPNSALTAAIKGSTEALVDDGDLFGALTSLVTDGGDLWVGVNRQRRKDGSADVANIALFLHEGFSIDVAKHPGVRIAAMARLREAAEKGNARARRIVKAMKDAARVKNRRAAMWSGYGSGKTIWVIPPRPFLADAITSPEFRDVPGEEYDDAVRRAVRRMTGVAA